MSIIAQRCGPDLYIAFSNGSSIELSQSDMMNIVQQSGGDTMIAASAIRSLIVDKSGDMQPSQINVSVDKDGQPLVLEIYN